MPSRGAMLPELPERDATGAIAVIYDVVFALMIRNALPPAPGPDAASESPREDG